MKPLEQEFDQLSDEQFLASATEGEGQLTTESARQLTAMSDEELMAIGEEVESSEWSPQSENQISSSSLIQPPDSQ